MTGIEAVIGVAAEQLESETFGTERLIMSDDEAIKWVWEQVKNDCDLHNLTVGESSTYFRFFMWGWRYRSQLERQRCEGE